MLRLDKRFQGSEVDHAPARFHVIAPGELTRAGFTPDMLWEGSLRWFEKFYQRHGGWPLAVAYWDWIATGSSNLAPAAVINQVYLDVGGGDITGAVRRIGANVELIRRTEWVKSRACEILKRENMPEARSILEQLEK